MRHFVVSGVVMLFLFGTASAQAQKGKKIENPAELFPADTLAYAEVQKHGDLAKEIRALFKGSVLYNVPNSLEKLKKKHPNIPWYRMDDVGIVGLPIAPEIVRELQRGRGAAVGLTDLRLEKAGPGDEPKPEYLAVLLPGKSNVPSFLLRIALTTGRMKVVASVDKVKIYQSFYSYRIKQAQPKEFGDDAGECAQVEEGIRYVGPAVAMPPGAILVGSVGAVKQAILRAKGKDNSPSLADNKRFQQLQKKVGSRPGVFGYANVPAVGDRIAKMLEKVPFPEASWLQGDLKLVNPKAFPGYALSASLQKGTFTYQEIALLDPKEKSPVLDLLPTKAFDTSLLRFAPPGSVMMIGLANDNGGKRWNRLIDFLDNTFLRFAFHNGQKFSDHLTKLEARLGFSISKDVMGNVTDVLFALGDVINAPVEKTVVRGPHFESVTVRPRVPMVLALQAKDDAAANKLMDLIPKICSAATGNPAKPQSKKIRGQTVFSIQMSSHYTVDYGRQGTTIVIGPYPEPIAAALAAADKKSSVIPHLDLQTRLQKLDRPMAVFVAKPVRFMLAAVTGMGHGYASESAVVDGAENGVVQPKNKQITKKVTIEKNTEAQKQIQKLFGDVLKLEQPFVLGVTRGDDFLQAKGSVGGLEKIVPTLADTAVEGMLGWHRVTSKAPKSESKPFEEFQKSDGDFKDNGIEPKKAPDPQIKNSAEGSK